MPNNTVHTKRFRNVSTERRTTPHKTRRTVRKMTRPPPSWIPQNQTVPDPFVTQNDATIPRTPIQTSVRAPVRAPIQTSIRAPVQAPIQTSIQTPIQTSIQTPIRSSAQQKRTKVRGRVKRTRPTATKAMSVPKTRPTYRAMYYQTGQQMLHRNQMYKSPVTSRDVQIRAPLGSKQSQIQSFWANKQVRHRSIGYAAVPNNILQEHHKEIPWPTELSQDNVYVITIRTDRWARITSRLGKWAKHAQRFPGTNGRNINARYWYKQNKLALKDMKRGRIGCYDSHRRVWVTIQQAGVPFGLILEDDADVRYCSEQTSRIQAALKTLEGRSWDVLLLGHYNDRKYKPGLGNGINLATRWQPLHAYLISQSGCNKLLKNAWPIRHPVDVYVGSQICKGLIMYRLDPRLCGQLHYGHDTEAIK